MYGYLQKREWGTKERNEGNDGNARNQGENTGNHGGNDGNVRNQGGNDGNAGNQSRNVRN